MNKKIVNVGLLKDNRKYDYIMEEARLQDNF